MKPTLFLNSGDLAPTFTALDQTGKSHSLSDYAGKTLVLYFYPQALTPGCTTQACELTENLSAFADRNCVVLGISPDEPGKLARFATKYDLKFDLLSDPDHAIADAYGVWGPKKFMGRVYDGLHRTTFILSAEGRLLSTLYPVKTKTHHDDVLQLLDAL